MSADEGKCRICGKPLRGADKIKSHYLTKATYYDAMNLKSGEHLTCHRGGDVIAKDMSHYATERLLCRECEQRIGVWENEREKLFSSNIRSSRRFEEEPLMEVYGYNQDYVKLACLADLFRCSEASSLPYSKISLGEKHGEIIRKMLLDGVAGDKYKYPMILLRYNCEEKMVDNACLIPARERGPDGINIYRVIAPRGWVWAVKVDQRSCNIFEEVSIGSERQKLKVLNYGNFKQSPEYGRIVKTVLG